MHHRTLDADPSQRTPQSRSRYDPAATASLGERTVPPTATAPTTAASGITFDVFKEQWLLDVTEGKPSTIELGRRFASKLLCQWLDIETTSDDLIYCDGSGDGGIDVAYLHRGEGQNP